MPALSTHSPALAAATRSWRPRVTPRSYQAVVLEVMAELWRSKGAPGHTHVLDIGAGNGTLARCIYALMPVAQVTALDVTDRLRSEREIATRTFDGQRLPFADATFAAATLNDVVPHVAPDERVALLGEIARTTAGPLYIKDRVARGPLDRLRVAVLGGSARARPLSMDDWRALAGAGGWRIAAAVRGRYRHGWRALLFPNRLELAMRWER